MASVQAMQLLPHLQARFRVVAQMPSREAASLSPTPNWPCKSSSRSFLPGFPLLPVPCKHTKQFKIELPMQVRQPLYSA